MPSLLPCMATPSLASRDWRIRVQPETTHDTSFLPPLGSRHFGTRARDRRALNPKTACMPPINQRRPAKYGKQQPSLARIPESGDASSKAYMPCPVRPGRLYGGLDLSLRSLTPHAVERRSTYPAPSALPAQPPSSPLPARPPYTNHATAGGKASQAEGVH